MFASQGMSLEVFITERLSTGKTLLSIAKELDFPAVHMTHWLTKEHPDLINAANKIYTDRESSRIMKESWLYDEDNYKADSAKHSTQLRILEKHHGSVSKSEDDLDKGMSFNIQVVMPDYVTGARTVSDEEDEKPVIEIGKHD